MIPALNSVVRSIGMPALDLWEVVLGRKVGIAMVEDSEASIVILKMCKSPSARHRSGAHGVSVA